MAMPVLLLAGPVARADIPWLCVRAATLLASCDADPVVCDVAGLEATADAVEVLARLQLTAYRSGRRLRVRNPGRELRDLIAIMGLRDVLDACEDSGGIQSRRQAEQREQPLRIEEEHDPGDPAA
jgi:ABC-type transporter Mla MlaB component